MVSIAIMVGGAVLNAVAFIGDNYLARALGCGDKDSLEEEVRHDKALEEYQASYAKYTCDCNKLLDWIATNAQIKAEAKQNFINADYAFKLYNLTSEWCLRKSRSCLISISQASSKKG